MRSLNLIAEDIRESRARLPSFPCRANPLGNGTGAEAARLVAPAGDLVLGRVSGSSRGRGGRVMRSLSVISGKSNDRMQPSARGARRG